MSVQTGCVVQLCGTSGAGKTTAMREVIEAMHYEHVDRRILHKWVEKKTGFTKEKVYILGRYYTYAFGAPAFVVGKYDSAACGGVDTLSAPGIADTMYPALLEVAQEGWCVLMEGLIQLQPVRAEWLLHQGLELHALYLATPIEVCCERIQQRRLARGNERPLNLQNTEQKHKLQHRAKMRLENAGAHTQWVQDTAAPGEVLRILREHQS